jgi:hypothetical protein
MPSSYAKNGTLIFVTKAQKKQLDKIKGKKEPYHVVIDKMLANYIQKRV